MAAIFEAPASHEAVHETAHEWEWEQHEGAHQPELQEWEAGLQSQEWEYPAGEWETSQEWEGTHEWEAGLESQEWEQPTGEWETSQEWEAGLQSQEWEQPTGEWETSTEWEAGLQSQEWEYPSGEWETSQWEIATVCPPAGQVIPFKVKRFSRYHETVQSLPSGEQETVQTIARAIVASFRPGCQPIKLVRFEGHADRDLARERREPGFERQISEKRALAVRNAVIDAIGDPAIARQVTMPVVGFGSSRRRVPNPVTEAQRQENRRVEVFLSVSAAPPRRPPPPPKPDGCARCIEEFRNSRLEGNARIARLRVCLQANGCEGEADPFIGKAFKKLGRGLGRLARRLAPFAVRALGSMIPGVGAIAGPVLGQIAQRVVREGESAANEVETEAFGGSHGEAEIGNSEVAHEAALAELLAGQAAEATSEAEALSAISATLPLTITIMRGDSVVRPVVPVLTQATARLARSLRKGHPQGRQLLRVVPSIERRAVGTIVAAARSGQPVTAPLAVRSLAQATRSVLGSPGRVESAVSRNVVLRRRTAPPSPRRALVYQPQRRAPYNPRRVAAYGQPRRYP